MKMNLLKDRLYQMGVSTSEIRTLSNYAEQQMNLTDNRSFLIRVGEGFVFGRCTETGGLRLGFETDQATHELPPVYSIESRWPGVSGADSDEQEIIVMIPEPEITVMISEPVEVLVKKTRKPRVKKATG